MAILDTLFGTPQSTMLGGLLGNEQMDKLRQQALTSGLINTAIGYLAQPKNQRFGSALPYVARALVAGQQGAQGVYDDALRSWQMQQKIDEVNREKAAREARQRVLPELLGMPSAYRGTTTQTVQGAEYATPTGDVSSPFTAQFQTQRMPDTQVQTPTFNESEYIKDLAMSGYGDKLLEANLAKERKSPFGQVDVSKFTPESIQKFEKTGVYSDLKVMDGQDKGFGAGVGGATLNFLSKGSGNSPDAVNFRKTPEYALAYREATKPQIVTQEKMDANGNVRSVQVAIPAPALPPSILPPIYDVGQQTISTGRSKTTPQSTPGVQPLSADGMYNIPEDIKSSPLAPSSAEIKEYRDKRNQAVQLKRTLDDLSTFLQKNPDPALWGVGATGATLQNKYEKALTQVRIAAQLGVLNKEDLPRLQAQLPNPADLTTWIKGGGTLSNVTAAIKSENESLDRDIELWDSYLNPNKPRKDTKQPSVQASQLPLKGGVIDSLKLKNGVTYELPGGGTGVWNAKKKIFE